MKTNYLIIGLFFVLTLVLFSNSVSAVDTILGVNASGLVFSSGCSSAGGACGARGIDGSDENVNDGWYGTSTGSDAITWYTGGNGASWVLLDLLSNANISTINISSQAYTIYDREIVYSVETSTDNASYHKILNSTDTRGTNAWYNKVITVPDAEETIRYIRVNISATESTFGRLDEIRPNGYLYPVNISITNSTYNMSSEGSCTNWNATKIGNCDTTDGTPTVSFSTNIAGSCSLSSISTTLYNNSIPCSTTGNLNHVCTIYYANRLVFGNQNLYASCSNIVNNVTSGALPINMTAGNGGTSSSCIVNLGNAYFRPNSCSVFP